MSTSQFYDHKRLIAPGESLTYGFDCSADLQAAETLVSIEVALAAVPVSADVTVGTAAVNSAEFTDDNGTAVAIGKGVQVQITIAADAADADYEIKGTANTSTGDVVAVRGGIEVRGP